MDDLAELAWNVYAPSKQSLALLSEKNRLFQPEKLHILEKPTIEPLTVLVVKFIAKTFNGGPIDDRIQLDDEHLLGELLNINLPIEKLCDVNIKVFWKRVIKARPYNFTDYLKACKDPAYKWKERGIEHKVVQLLETTSPDEWHLDYMEPIMQTVAPYVTELDIQELQPIKGIYLEAQMPKREFFDLDEDLCNHGTLEILGHLKNLRVLKIRFGLKHLEREFQRRFNKFSVNDALGLGTGLNCLDKLQVFSLNRSDCNAKKLEHIAKSMRVAPLVEIDLSYCKLGQDCGKWISLIFEKNETLKRLELRGNFLDGTEMAKIENTLFDFKGTLDYFGLSMNPLKFEGIANLGRGFFGTRHVKELNLSGCQNTSAGVWRVLQIIQAHSILTHLDMSGMDLTDKRTSQKLLKLLEENYNLEELECRECGLSLECENKIKQILVRNRRKKYPPEPPFTFKPKSYDHRRTPIPFDTFPSFIPDEQRIILSNTQVLQTHFNSCFGTDSDMKLFDDVDEDYDSELELKINRHNLQYYRVMNRQGFLDRAK